MRTRQIFLLSAICLAVGITTAGLLVSREQSTPTPGASALGEHRQADPVAARHTNQTLQTTAIEALPKLPALPRSLQGSDHDVRLHTDADGNLLIEADILHLFEFYLSALVEEPLELCLTRISLALAEQLQGAALDQARDLLKRYLDFKIALVELHALPGAVDASGAYALDAIELRQQRLRDLRLQHFSAHEAQVFFQEEDSYDDYMLQRLKLAQDQSLDPAERQQALERLEQQLPEAMRQARQQATQQTQLYELTEQMKQDGASAEALFQARAEVLGDEAATALAELDQRQAQWNSRLASYEEEREAIRQSGLSTQDQQAAVASLIERRFEPEERLQVQAMELYQ
nr:lipase secretion chaperone [uncultured Pseudomonas sp.]